MSVAQTKPTSAATYERARRLANLSLWAIDLQCRRLRTSDPQDKDFVFRKWADFDFLVIALTRLRRGAKLAGSAPEVEALVSAALKEFDAALPDLKRMRDVAEHVDDYALDQGRSHRTVRQALAACGETHREGRRDLT